MGQPEIERSRQFWLEKIEWKDAGDRAPGLTRLDPAQETAIRAGLTDLPFTYELAVQGPRNVLRQGGEHYTVRTFGVGGRTPIDCKGHGGRVFHWFWLDDPLKIVQQSDDVFAQGKIPPEFRDELPDNVEWVS